MYDSPSHKFDKRNTRSESLLNQVDDKNMVSEITFKMSGVSKIVPSGSSSTFIKRRVNEDGIKMLDEHFNLKLTNNQVTFLLLLTFR